MNLKEFSPFLIIVSNILVCIALGGLRSLGFSTLEQIIILALSNFLTYFFLALKDQSFSPIFKASKENKTLIPWAIGYVLIYGGFFYFPGIIKLSHLVVIKCLTPMLAVFIAKDHKSEDNSALNLLIHLLPLGLLIGIAYIESVTSTNLPLLLGMLAIMGVSFLVNQSGARILSKKHPPLEITKKLSFFNALFLFALLIFEYKGFPPLQLIFIPYGCLFALLIISLQFFYLKGLKLSPPYLSALFISSSIPITLMWDYLVMNKAVTQTSLFLGFIYLVVIAAKTLKNWNNLPPTSKNIHCYNKNTSLK